MSINLLKLSNQNLLEKKDFNFKEITFYTKEEFENIIFEEEFHEIAWEIKQKFEEKKDNKYIFEKLKNKNINFLNKFLVFLIKNWLPNIKKFKDYFNLDTKELDVDIFYEWFVNRYNWLDQEYNLEGFIWMCKNKQELLKKIVLSWNIDIIVDYISIYDFEFKKLNNEEDENTFLYNFDKDLKLRDLFQKINFISSYDWEVWLSFIFENYTEVYYRLENLFDLKEEEKEEFEKLKKDKYFDIYAQKKEELILNLEEENFSEIWEYEFFGIVWDEVWNEFINKINEIIISLNHSSLYVIEFLDIWWKKITYNLWNDSQNYDWYNYNLFSIEDFKEHLMEEYWKFKLNFEKNNMDFSIIVFKRNWIKNNNSSQEEENFLLAA